MDNVKTQNLVGISGWEHDMLDACFYPDGTAGPMDKLSFYSRFFDVVETRATFWDDTLGQEDAQQWIEAVAPNRQFQFCIKLHSSFTHKRTVRSLATRNVRALLCELSKHNRLGSLLLQFPYAFTNTSSNRFHLIKMAEIFRGFPMHVELRHDSWHQPSLLSFLEEHTLHPVNADMPRIRQFMPFFTGVLGEDAYMRLHGRNEKGWLLNGMDTRYDYLYNGREIQELRRRIETAANTCTRGFVICNNRTGGKALANAFQLRSALRDGKQLPVPLKAVSAFPFLRSIACLRESEESLFAQASFREAM